MYSRIADVMLGVPFSGHFWILWSAMLLGGCGLADYEQRMVEQAAKFQRFDDEFKFLDEPVTVPRQSEDEEKKNPTPPLFLRLPRGLARTANQELYGNLLLVYPRITTQPAAKIAGTVACYFEAVYLALTTSNKDFREEVLNRFPIKQGNRTTVPLVKQPPDRETMNFEALTCKSDNSTFYICVYTNGNIQIALVYQVDPSHDRSQEVLQAMDLSLDTLAVGQDASASFNLLNKRQARERGQ